MEQGPVFPFGKQERNGAGQLTSEHHKQLRVASLDVDRLSKIIAAQGAPGRRSAPKGPDDRSPGSHEPPRGDHDLNPDFYDPRRALTPAAVLVPIIERGPDLHVLLTLRTDHLHDHAGQIAFPGGRIEDLDKTAEHCALRETHEEVGLPPERVRLVGRLDTYVTRTGFEVTPVVGLVRAPYPVKPDRFEVAEVFEVPLEHFLLSESLRMDSRMFEGRERHFYAFAYGRHYIWGATAGMLVNLVDILSDAQEG